MLFYIKVFQAKGSEGKFLRERENFARKQKDDQIRTEVPERKAEKKNPKGFLFGAGEGNRTLAASLEGWSSTTELHPHFLNANE